MVRTPDTQIKIIIIVSIFDIIYIQTEPKKRYKGKIVFYLENI